MRLAALAAALLLAAGPSRAQLAGTYTVGGASPDYSTLALAVSDLNDRGVSGPVKLLVRPGVYDGALVLGSIPGTSPGNDVQFQPSDPSVPPVLRHTAATAATNYVVRLDGTTDVSFIGLRFEATGASELGRLIQIQSGAARIVIQGCTFVGLPGTTDFRASLVSALFSGDLPGLVVRQNTFTQGYTGLELGAGASASGLQVEDNVFDGQHLAGAQVAGAGVVARNQMTDSPTASTGYTGLAISNGADAMRVTGNRVVVRRGRYGIHGTAAALINNSVWMNSPSGQHAISIGGTLVAHNTVRASLNANALLRQSISSYPTTLHGNLLIATGSGVALYINGTLAASDHNNLYSNGPALVRHGPEYATLAAWQAASGLDGASVSQTVTFASTAGASPDLHLGGASLTDARLVAGTIPEVPRDIDNDLRDPFNAKMGADEGTPLPPLAGDYAVGAQSGQPPPAYASLHDALFAVEALGVSGPVQLRLAPAPLVGPFTVRPFAGASAINRLTLVGTFGSPNTPTLHNPGTGPDDNAALRIDGADHVTLSYLTLQGTLGSGPYGRALVLTGEVEDLVVGNVDFRGRMGTGANAAALVFGSDGTTSGLVIQNSLFTNGSVGIQLTADTGPAATGTVLSNVTMLDVAAGGVYLVGHDAPQLVDVFVSTAASNTTGILLSQGAGGTVAQAQLRVGDDTGSRALVLALQSGTAATPTRVENSFLTAGGNALYATQTDHLRVVHTSLLATAGASGSVTLLRIGGSDHVYRNNVLVQSAGQRVLVGTGTSAGVAESDHNVLRTTGPTLATVSGIDYATLAAYQSATGLDGASVNVPVAFANVAEGDLHLAGASIGDAALAAPPLPDVPRDFDNQLRSTTAVYRGADESATPVTPTVMLGVTAWLQGGGADGGLMRTSLAAAGALPLTQPYADPAFDGTALDYDGTESVPAGFFATGPGSVFVDWVLVGLRATPDGPDVARRALLLTNFGSVRNGATGTVYSFPVVPGSYHVVVYHRNHLPMMSTARALSATSTSVSLLSASGVVGGTSAGVAMSNGVLALAAGDADADGAVLAPDRQSVWLPAVGQSGYQPGDVNLDGSVLADDLNGLWLPNVGRQTLVPGASSRPAPPSPPAARGAAILR